MKKFVLPIATFTLLLLLPLVVRSPYYLRVLTTTFVFVIMTVSLRMIFLSGQLSFGHAGVMSVGAYTSAALAKFVELSAWLTMPIGVIATGLVGLIAGTAFSRLRHVYFVIGSMLLGMGLLGVVNLFSKYTGGSGSAMPGIPRMLEASAISYYYFFLVLTSVLLGIMYRLEHCRIGSVWRAVAQSPDLAQSIGIDERRQRIFAFTVGCVMAGIAGATYAHYGSYLSQEVFGFMTSLYLVIYLFVGGASRMAGPIIGTVALFMIPELARDLKEYVPYVNLAILLVVLYFMPRGIVGLPQQLREAADGRRDRPTRAPLSSVRKANRGEGEV